LFQHFLCGKKSDQPLKPLERKVPEATFFQKSPKSYQFIFIPKAFYVIFKALESRDGPWPDPSILLTRSK